MADLAPNAALVIGSNVATRRKEYTLGFASAQAGQIVVLNSSNQWVKTDANAGIGTNITDTIGILETGGNTNQPCTVIVEDSGLNVGAILTNGVAFYASPNAGMMAPVADITGSVGVFLGMSRSTSLMYFKPVVSGATV